MTDTPESPKTPVVTEIRAEHARSFGQAADLYNRNRPGYPVDALRWGLGTRQRHIADIGAGTGILTRGLIALGHRLTAIEPDEGMLTKLTASTPGLVAGHLGEAEALPLPDASVDAVVAGQAYHWFDPTRALPEFVRVLRPGGVFTPIWNVRDERVDWVARLSKIVGSSAAEITAGVANRVGYFAPYFQNLELRIFEHEKPLDANGLLRLMQSRSYYLTADDHRKAEIDADVTELVKTHPDLAGRDVFAMPYATYVYRMAAA